MTAVDPSHSSGGVGYALKLRQRELCLAQDIQEIRWTFDPLIRRNAHFNIRKLGAEVIAYHPDFYGELADRITGTDRSDRFEVRWRLDSPRVIRAISHSPWPDWPAGDDFELDDDFEKLRHERPDLAAKRRLDSRAAFVRCFDRGERPELDGAGNYVFAREDPDWTDHALS